jgi:hypothetical protein
MTRFKQYLRYDVAQQALSISLHDPRHPLIEPHHPVLDGVAEAVGCVGILVLFHLNVRTSNGVGVGMRCGVVACLLSNEKETKHVIDFALDDGRICPSGAVPTLRRCPPQAVCCRCRRHPTQLEEPRRLRPLGRHLHLPRHPRTEE